jgi:hypothetical protein
MSPDVAIVGAGPVRGVTALAFADAGAETRPVRVRRAGHPPERLGVDLSAVQHCRVGGFIVHPEDGSAPIRLPYPRGGYGLSCHHQSLVQGLRATLSHQPGVALVPRDARYRRQPAHLRFRTRLGGRVHPGRMAGRCRGQRLADTPVARYPIAADLPLAHGRDPAGGRRTAFRGLRPHSDGRPRTAGIRYAGARSHTWDTAFAAEALAAYPESADATAATAHAYLRQVQLARRPIRRLPEGRAETDGGWCFSAGGHRWPVSDCTAEAVSALGHVEQSLPDEGDAVRAPGDWLQAAAGSS